MWWFINKTKERLQLDPVECGAVSLGIILEYLGYYATNLELRNACKVSRHGATASHIIDGAKEFGLSGRAKRVTAHDLKKVFEPIILFFNQSHFVVFEGYYLGRYYINDPALGRYSQTSRDFLKHFSRVAIFLAKTENFITRKSGIRPSFNQKLAKVCFCIMGFIFGAASIVFASIVGFIAAHHMRYQGMPMTVMLLSLVTVAIILWYLLQILTDVIVWVSQQEDRKHVSFLLNSLPIIPSNFFDDIPFDSFAQSYGGSGDNSLCFYQALGKKYFFTSFLLVVGFALIFMVPLFSFIIILFAIIIVILFFFENNVRLHSPFINAQDFFHGQSLAFDMQAMGQEDFLLNGLIKKRINLLPLLLNQTRKIRQLVLNPIFIVLLIITVFASIFPQFWQLGFITAPEIITCFVLGFAFCCGMLQLQPISASYSLWPLQQEIKEQLKDKQGALEAEGRNSIIELKQITFIHRGETDAILENVSLVIKPGQIVGVTGASGSGKSSLMKILAGGCVLQKGHVIHGKKSLRIALIDDGMKAMKATVKENVTLFNKAIDDELIIDALKNACALDLFYNRPLGLMALIDDQSMNLSDSENMRLLLAASLAHQADVILLDNFFPYLDEKLALEIINNFRQKNITAVFTSSCEKELSLCDKIVVVSNKNIFERGDS